jgi:hypothetical protein
VIILYTGKIFPDYLIPKVISDYLSIAFREIFLVTVAKHVIILVIMRSLATPYAGPHKLFKSFLKLPRCGLLYIKYMIQYNIFLPPL